MEELTPTFGERSGLRGKQKVRRVGRIVTPVKIATLEVSRKPPSNFWFQNFWFRQARSSADQPTQL
jgi:hypothetical protein